MKGRNKKRGFFNFGSKKAKSPKRIDDSQRRMYDSYIADAQIETQQEAQFVDDIAEVLSDQDHRKSRDNSPERHEQRKKRGGFANFFGGFKKSPPQHQQVPVQEPPQEPSAEPVPEATQEPEQDQELEQPQKPAQVEEKEFVQEQGQEPTAEPAVEVGDDLNSTIRSNTSGSDHEGRGRQKKPKGGLKGFFRAPGLKSNRPKSPYRIGNVEAVDVSHLVDDEEFTEEPPLKTSEPKHEYPAEKPETSSSIDETESDKDKRETNALPATKHEGIPLTDAESTEPEPTNEQPESVQTVAAKDQQQEEAEINVVAHEEPREPIEMSPPVPTSARGRSRKKSGSGLKSLFGGGGRQTSRSRLPSESEPNQPRQRAKSLPRRSGFSGLFGGPPQPRRPRQMSTERVPNNQAGVEHEQPQAPRSRQSKPNFFSLDRKPRRQRQPQEQQQPQQDFTDINDIPQDEDDNFPPNFRERRSSKGLGGLFASTKRLRKDRNNMPRSTSMPSTNRPLHQPQQQQPAPEQPSMLASLYGEDSVEPEQLQVEPEQHQVDQDKIDVAPVDEVQPPVPNNQPHQSHQIQEPTPESRGDPPMADLQTVHQHHEEPQPDRNMPNQGQNRVKGRQTGRFRKSSTGSTIPASYGVRPPSSMAEGATARPPTEQSLMQDIFVENSKRPSRPSSAAASRRNSVGSNMFESNSAEDLADAEYASGSAARQPLRKSASSLGRSESYKQARGGDIDGEPNLTRVGPHRSKAYGSMPRLHNRQQRQPTGPMMSQRPHSRNGHRSDEPCKVM